MSAYLLFIFSVTIFSTFTTSSSDRRFEVCSKPFECGGSSSFKNATYPFWGANKDAYCGRTGFELTCKNQQYLTIDIDSISFRVLNISMESQIITVVNKDIFFGACPETFNFYATNQFALAATVEEIELFNCTDDKLQSRLLPLTCNTSNSDDKTYYYVNLSYPNQHTLPPGCAKIGEVPILKSAMGEIQRGLALTLNHALSRGFDLKYFTNDSSCGKCLNSNGYCGYNSSTQHFQCFCNDKPHKSSCDDEAGINWRLKSIIGVAACCFGVVAASSAWYLYHRRKIRRYQASSLLLSTNISSEPSSKSSGLDVEKTGGLSVEVHLFTYEELEQATNNFDPSEELGDGGYGTVYYGKLQDGRTVAVKRLYEHNYKRVEQFMNEVEILTRLRHPNLVSLFGCTSRHSRELLLVYEYIPNGTLADHLHSERAKPILLPWPTRLKIAMETASALKYLHASDIIHRDVKSNNILLDRNFCVKVADFGLSRLFPTDKTHVSTAPQGTPGYVDPDYHQCYQLTNKSDVFSFGVVLMELISSMPAVDITRRRLEINLSNMAINKIQNRTLHEMVDHTLGFDSDTKVRQMVIAVAELAYQCLQTDKDLRPSMSEVLEALLRIQNDGYGPNKVEEVNVDEDDVVLMNSGPLVVQSPSTVMVKWDSVNSS